MFSLPGTSVVGILDRRFDPFLPADPQYAFVVCLDVMILLQIILYSTISLVRTFRVDLLDLISNSVVL